MTGVAFAFGAGLLATVNPCGFAMLPAFLGYYVAGGNGGEPVGDRADRVLLRLAQGLTVGVSVSLGFAGVFVTAALLASAGLKPLLRYVPWLAVVIGVALVGVGIALLAGRHVGVRVGPHAWSDEDRSLMRVVAFGAAYALVSLSCTLGVLLAVVAQALATKNIAAMVGVLLAYGAGAATVLTSLSVSAALAKGALARGMRQVLPLAGRLGGGLLVASGLYLVAYWLPALAAGRPNDAVRAVSELFSGPLTELLDANRGSLAGVAVVLVVAGVVLVARQRTPPATPKDQRSSSHSSLSKP